MHIVQYCDNTDFKDRSFERTCCLQSEMEKRELQRSREERLEDWIGGWRTGAVSQMGLIVIVCCRGCSECSLSLFVSSTTHDLTVSPVFPPKHCLSECLSLYEQRGMRQ